MIYILSLSLSLSLYHPFYLALYTSLIFSGFPPLFTCLLQIPCKYIQTKSGFLFCFGLLPIKHAKKGSTPREGYCCFRKQCQYLVSKSLAAAAGVGLNQLLRLLQILLVPQCLNTMKMIDQSVWEQEGRVEELLVQLTTRQRWHFRQRCHDLYDTAPQRCSPTTVYRQCQANQEKENYRWC